MKLKLTLISLLFSYAVFGQTVKAKTDTTYSFKCKLLDQIPLPTPCGVIAFAAARKFEIISSAPAIPLLKYATIIIQCPSVLGDAFFIKDQLYLVKAGKSNDAGFTGSIFPADYVRKGWPVYWCKNISMLKE